MANTLGNPTLISDKARENQILSFNTSLTSEPVIANPLLRVRAGSVTLVDFPLDPTTPFLGAAGDGSAAFNFVSASVLATGGTASLPTNYQVLGRDNAVHLSGAFLTATDPITVGQNVSAASVSATAPAS